MIDENNRQHLSVFYISCSQAIESMRNNYKYSLLENEYMIILKNGKSAGTCCRCNVRFRMIKVTRGKTVISRVNLRYRDRCVLA